MSRQPSSKTSRNGCAECKNRRMKCSKEQPRCSACVRHNILCQYLSSTTWPITAPRSSSPIDLSPRASPPDSESRAFSTYEDSMDSIRIQSPPVGLNLEELELMMQWCTATYRSISRNNTVEWIWHAVVPREAMKHPYLMHGILALSALHLAFTTGGSAKESYIRTAQAHHSRAINGLRTKVTESSNQSDCDATFALSSIMIVYSFGFTRMMRPPADKTVLDELCEVFHFARGSADVLTEVIGRVGDGELKPLLECNDSQPKMPDTSRLAMMSLSRMNASLALQSPSHEKAMFDAAIEHVGSALEKLARGGEILVIAFQWMFDVPCRFIALLRQRHPFALVILAHYAVIINSLRGHWWMGEWGARIIEYIGQNLDPEWRTSISWVVDATGCYIPPV